MATPAKTIILNEIGARLASITTANGYFYTIKRIENARRAPWPNDSEQLPAITYWNAVDVRAGAGGGYESRNVEIFIQAATTDRDRPFTLVANELETDIEIALNRAVTAPRATDAVSTRLGGLISSMFTRESEPDLAPGDVPYCGVLMVFECNYKRHLHDPFSLIPN